MKNVLKRQDNTSIFCAPVQHQYFSTSVKKKVLELSVGCTLLVVGFFIMTAL